MTAEIKLLGLATSLTDKDNSPGDSVRRLSKEDAEFLQAAIESATDVGASNRHIQAALTRLNGFLTAAADDDDDEEEEADQAAIDALETLHEEFEDLNKTAVLTSASSSAAVEMLLWLWDQRLAADASSSAAASSSSSSGRGWRSDVPLGVRRAALSTISAALHSNPPVQQLLARYGFLPRVLHQLHACRPADAATTDVLRLVAALSAFTANHADNERALIDGNGVALLLPWTQSPDARLAVKTLFLLRNIVRHHSPAVLPADFAASAVGLFTALAAADNESLIEQLAAFLEEATSSGDVRQRIVQALPDANQVKLGLLQKIAAVERDEDRQEERAHLRGLFANLFLSA